MKNFINIIKKRDKKISKFFVNQKLEKLEKIYHELQEEHQEIKENLKEVNYLLDLINKHKIDVLKDSKSRQNELKGWLKGLRKSFEKFHFFSTKKLTDKDIAYLQGEKSKLLYEKDQLEKEHHHIHHLLAKTDIYLMDTRNNICKEITKGYDIAQVGEKLLEHFGKNIDGVIDYEAGRKEIMKMLEKKFSITKVQSKLLFDLLEKSKVIRFDSDISNIIQIEDYEDFDEFINTNYIPVTGNWIINA